MLTVKHMRHEGGEVIYEATKVITERVDPDHDRVRLDTPKDGIVDLEAGTVYVMNDKANTVAKYHLPAPPPVDASATGARGTLADQPR